MKELPNPTFPLSPLVLPRGSLHRRSDQAVQPGAAMARGGIEVAWARHQDEVQTAQRLRFNVFASEVGARLDTSVPGHDAELFDDYCEHLLVREQITREVIGTYRVLTPAPAQSIGNTYSDLEFDLMLSQYLQSMTKS